MTPAISSKRVPSTLGLSCKAWTGTFTGPPHLVQELKFYILLQAFCLGLAVLSAALGFQRTLSLCSSFPHAWWLALTITVFIAASAWIFVSYALGQVGFLLAGGKVSRGQKVGLVVSLLLALSVIGLDIGLNMSSVEPVANLLTEEPVVSQTEAISAQYDSLITAVEQQRDTMQVQYFTYKGKLYIPDQPTRWISQEVLDSYAGLQEELTLLRRTRAQELANEASRVQEGQERFTNERTAKVDMLSMVVGLLYLFMILAATKAGMVTGMVWEFSVNGGESGTASTEVEEPVAPAQLQLSLEGLAQEDIPSGGSGVASPKEKKQRGIDQAKYQRCLRYAREVMAERGKYVKQEIAKRSGISRDTVTHYIARAIELGDLEA